MKTKLAMMIIILWSGLCVGSLMLQPIVSAVAMEETTSIYGTEWQWNIVPKNWTAKHNAPVYLAAAVDANSLTEETLLPEYVRDDGTIILAVIPCRSPLDPNDPTNVIEMKYVRIQLEEPEVLLDYYSSNSSSVYHTFANCYHIYDATTGKPRPVFILTHTGPDGKRLCRNCRGIFNRYTRAINGDE